MFLVKPPEPDNENTQPPDLTCSLILLELTPFLFSPQFQLFELPSFLHRFGLGLDQQANCCKHPLTSTTPFAPICLLVRSEPHGMSLPYQKKSITSELLYQSIGMHCMLFLFPKHSRVNNLWKLNSSYWGQIIGALVCQHMMICLCAVETRN